MNNGDDQVDSERAGFWRRVVDTLRETPTVVVPFTLLGLLATGIEVLRQSDPVVTVPQTAAQQGWVHVTFPVYPRPFEAVGTTLAGTLGLEIEWLLRTATLETVALIGAAGAMVGVVRMIHPEQSRPVVGFVRLAAYELGLAGALLAIEYGLLVTDLADLVALPLMIVLLYLYVRLFTVPALLAQGEPIVTALRESTQRTWLSGWTRLGLLCLFGLCGHLAVSLPVVVSALPLPAGTAFATATVGTFHAVAVVVATT